MRVKNVIGRVGLLWLIAVTTLPDLQAQTARDLDLSIPKLVARDSSEGGPGVHAIIVQGSYDDRQFDQPMIGWSIEGPIGDPSRPGLRSVLEDKLGFDSVHVVRDEAVTEAGLRSALRQRFQSMKGAGNVLYLHWIGHGYYQELQDETSERRYFTYFTQKPKVPGGTPTATLSYRDIATIVNEAREELPDGADVRVAVCFDACSVAALSPGPGTTRIVVDEPRRFDLEAFSSGQGREALREVGDGLTQPRTAFTGALADYLGRLATTTTRPIDLKRAFEEAAAAAANQMPESGGEELIVFRPQSSTLEIRVVNGEDQSEPLPDARVELVGLGRKERGADVQFTGLRTPGRRGYRVLVSAPGFCSRQIDVMQRNKHVTVPLVRAFDLLQVQVVARRGVGTDVVLGPTEEPLAPIHHTSKRATGSERVILAVPAGLGNMSLEARPDGGDIRVRDLDASMFETTDFGSVQTGDPATNAVAGDQLVGIRNVAVTSPLFVSADKLRLEARIVQDADSLVEVSVKGSSLAAKPKWGSKDVNLDLPYTGGEVVLMIHSRDGSVLREIPCPIGSPDRMEGRGALAIPVFSMGEIDLRPSDLQLAGSIDLGATSGTVRLAVLPDNGTSPRDMPAGDFRLSLSLDQGPGLLRIDTSDGRSTEVPFDPAKAVLKYSDGRMVKRLDLGSIQIAASVQAAAGGAAAAPAGFWDHLMTCEKELEQGDIKGAKKAISAAKKLLPSSKDERQVFIDYYRALSKYTEAGKYTSQNRESRYATARGAFEKICKKDSAERDPRGVSPHAMSLYYIARLRSRDLLAYEKPSTRLRRDAERAVEALRTECPDDKDPQGKRLVDRLNEDLALFARAR